MCRDRADATRPARDPPARNDLALGMAMHPDCNPAVPRLSPHQNTPHLPGQHADRNRTQRGAARCEVAVAGRSSLGAASSESIVESTSYVSVVGVVESTRGIGEGSTLHSLTFDLVVRTRPDVAYHAPRHPWCAFLPLVAPGAVAL